ncbi:MAG: hypothetical protein Q7S28_04080 [bacterium]|nr:hypothetical protein [bacterium]
MNDVSGHTEFFSDSDPFPFGWLLNHWKAIGRTSFVLGVFTVAFYLIVHGLPALMGRMGYCLLILGIFMWFAQTLDVPNKPDAPKS